MRIISGSEAEKDLYIDEPVAGHPRWDLLPGFRILLDWSPAPDDGSSPMITVLIVDDSSFMRQSLAYILRSSTDIEIVGFASDGAEAVHKTKLLHPDVVLLDIEMPVMDGLTALIHIMADCPTRVIMLSGLNREDATIALESLDRGAVDFIPKPSGVISYDIGELHDELISKVRVVAGVDVHKGNTPSSEETLHYRLERTPAGRAEMIVIGASTGGPRAVEQLLSFLPRNIKAAIVVVQHMGPEFLVSFAQRLQSNCSLDVAIAGKGDAIEPGRVLIAPGGYRTLFQQSGSCRRIRLSKDDSLSSLSPCIDRTMASAAKVYGEAALGVLLTGSGSDGAQGMKAIREAGGGTIAEDASTCLIFGMPKAAIELGCVDEVLPLAQIGAAVLRRTAPVKTESNSLSGRDCRSVQRLA